VESVVEVLYDYLLRIDEVRADSIFLETGSGSRTCLVT
jgi:hypothetical protein